MVTHHVIAFLEHFLFLHHQIDDLLLQETHFVLHVQICLGISSGSSFVALQIAFQSLNLFLQIHDFVVLKLTNFGVGVHLDRVAVFQGSTRGVIFHWRSNGGTHSVVFVLLHGRGDEFMERVKLISFVLTVGVRDVGWLLGMGGGQ